MSYSTKKLGILGGGQLARMSTLAAARLGIETYIFCPDHDSPASQVSAHTTVAEYSDKKALKTFAESVDVVSYEFENIPVETLEHLKQFVPVFPDERLLEVSQHRGIEKKFLNDIGLKTAKWALAYGPEELEKLSSDMACNEYILKTTRFGYDGKGQAGYVVGDDSKAKWKELNTNEIIIEEKLDFACEISVIVARDKLGQMAIYGPSMNEHHHGILAKSTIPAPIPEQMAAEARNMVEILAEAVDLIGVLALELFVTKDGDILANEIAPRTHNSGHWSIDACSVSQFEQHVRTVCGLHVGLPARHSDAVMLNLIGNDVKKLGKWYEMRGACMHIYGKKDVRAGRKMGHVTLLKPNNTDQKLL